MSLSSLSHANTSAYPKSKPSQIPPPQPIRPTIILVHGGWQGPETYSPIIPGLEKAGYSVLAVTLPSAGSVPATPDMSSDVNIVRNAVTSTLAIGKDVVLVMHSYGAVVGCEALKGVKQDEAGLVMESDGAVKVGKVMKLAFIAALLFPAGKATWNEEKGSEAVPGFSSFASPLTYAAYRDFPSSYLMCTNDKAVPFPIQKRFIAMAGITDITTIASGHSPMISQPKAVEMFIRRCAGEDMARL
ncbi:MAG: hypothetical protein Q9166_006007 [cf. Caloplaca sp. 2 TL-2023]